jgi:hypothetical protein
MKTYCGLENTLIAPVGLRRFAYFLLGRFWVDDLILSRNLLLISLLILALLGLVLLESRFELTFQVANLAVLGHIMTRTRSIRLEKLDLILDLRVENLGLGNEVLNLGRG